jgi:hypothetical protein
MTLEPQRSLRTLFHIIPNACAHTRAYQSAQCAKASEASEMKKFVLTLEVRDHHEVRRGTRAARRGPRGDSGVDFRRVRSSKATCGLVRALGDTRCRSVDTQGVR